MTAIDGISIDYFKSVSLIFPTDDSASTMARTGTEASTRSVRFTNTGLYVGPPQYHSNLLMPCTTTIKHVAHHSVAVGTLRLVGLKQVSFYFQSFIYFAIWIYVCFR